MNDEEEILMRSNFVSLLVALSTSALVGGLFAYHFGYVLPQPLTVHGLGIFDGIWSPADYSFLGAVLASLGCGGMAGLFLPPGRTTLRHRNALSACLAHPLSEENIMDLHARLDRLQQEMQEVRGTSYDYHVSCDTSVVRIAERLGNLEAQQRNPVAVCSPTEAQVAPVQNVQH